MQCTRDSSRCACASKPVEIGTRREYDTGFVDPDRARRRRAVRQRITDRVAVLRERVGG
jgi:hypothetical protein